MGVFICYKKLLIVVNFKSFKKLIIIFYFLNYPNSIFSSLFPSVLRWALVVVSVVVFAVVDSAGSNGVDGRSEIKQKTFLIKNY